MLLSLICNLSLQTGPYYHEDCMASGNSVVFIYVCLLKIADGPTRISTWALTCVPPRSYRWPQFSTLRERQYVDFTIKSSPGQDFTMKLGAELR